MSKLSLYESKWTDLVFENRNKEYGAYQLRQENAKTTVTALFMGLLLLTSIGSVSMLISKLTTTDVVADTPPDIPLVVTPLDLSKVVQPKIEEPIAPPAQQSAAAPVTDARQLVNPVVARTPDAVQDIAPNIENVPVVENTNGTGNSLNPIPGNGGGVGNGGPASIATPTNEPFIPTALDKMPEFPGGIQNFYNYVGRNFNRPELDEEKTLRVYVSFIVERDGSLTDIVVKNDPGYGMGKEAVRVLKSLKTKWSPGILDGKAVRTAYNLPITIKTQVE
jgi:protein TonB